MANKKTRKEIFGEMKEIFEEMGKTEYVEFLTHQIKLLDNKASSQKGISKTQKENETIMEIMVDELKAIGRSVTITELLKESETLANYITIEGKNITNQKASALMKKLKDAGKVQNMIDKKKSYFWVD